MARRASTPTPEPEAVEPQAEPAAPAEPIAPADLPADDTTTVEVTDSDDPDFNGTGEHPTPGAHDGTDDTVKVTPPGYPIGDERIDTALDHADDDPPGGRRPLDENPDTGPRALSPEERAGDTRGGRQGDDGAQFGMTVTRGTFTHMVGARRVSAFPGDRVTLSRRDAERGLRLGVLQESAPDDVWE